MHWREKDAVGASSFTRQHIICKILIHGSTLQELFRLKFSKILRIKNYYWQGYEKEIHISHVQTNKTVFFKKKGER
jgi:hypothetical protein